MALFMKRRMIFEADDDNAGGEGNAAAGENNDQAAAGNDDAGNGEDQAADDTGDDNADDEDYSIDTDDDNGDSDEDDNGGDEDEGDDESDDEGNTEDDSSDEDEDMGSEDDSDGEDSENKQMDREMFSTLSEDEQKRKVLELKKLYIELYSKADGLIQKFGQVGAIDDEEFGSIIKRMLNILYEMKQYVSDYVLNIYDKSSYIENDITFNRYLCVLDGIKLAVEELDKQRNPDEKDKK